MIFTLMRNWWAQFSNRCAIFNRFAVGHRIARCSSCGESLQRLFKTAVDSILVSLVLIRPARCQAGLAKGCPTRRELVHMRYVIALMLAVALSGCSPRDKWQYMLLFVPAEMNDSLNARLVLNRQGGDQAFDVSGEIAALNKVGEYGWQVVTVEQKEFGRRYLFKRAARADEGWWYITVPKKK